MRKGNLAGVFCIAIILSTAVYIYINSDVQNKEPHILSLVDIKKGGGLVNVDLVENIQNQPPQITHVDGKYVDNIDSCINVSEIEHQVNSEMYEEFLRDNTLSLWTVNNFLRELSNNDLELEFKSGSAEAAFVLGMNLIYSSYNTSKIHPDLSRGVQQEKPNERKELDSKQLSVGRDWLWIAALNGIGIALAEVGSSYRLESHLIEQQFKLSNRSDHENLISLKAKLVAQELSFLMLYHEVNSSIVELHQLDSDYENERFSNHEYDEKEKILKELKEKWALNREGIGESYEINIKIPEEIKK